MDIGSQFILQIRPILFTISLLWNHPYVHCKDVSLELV